MNLPLNRPPDWSLNIISAHIFREAPYADKVAPPRIEHALVGSMVIRLVEEQKIIFGPVGMLRLNATITQSTT